MTNEQIIEFLSEVKKDYPKIKNYKDDYDEWKEVLSKLDYDLVKEKYKEHKLNPEFKDHAPSCKFFQTVVSEKRKNFVYLTRCVDCDKIFYSNNLDRHYLRHLSVNYIVRNKKSIWNIDTTSEEYQKFMEMNEEIFEEKYEEFLKQVFKFSKSDTEKERIKKILYLGEHQGETLALNTV